MSKASLEISVSPAVIKWARQTAGWGVEDITKRLKIPAAEYSKWESSETLIKVKHLQELARCFKRPLAAFLLSDPPKEPGPPTDFRLLPSQGEQFDKKTRFAIRKANRLRRIAAELMQNIGRDPTPILGRASISDSPEGIAQEERKRLGVDLQAQLGWHHSWEAYRGWRQAVEENNILVFQFPMPIGDARGFSLSKELPYAVVMSSSDTVNARIFTLFHEIGHLLLRNPGICLPGGDPPVSKPEGQVENWCNRFAGSLLLPRDAVQGLLGKQRVDDSQEALLEAITNVSRTFKVSEAAAVVRLFQLEAISRDAFRREIRRLNEASGSQRRGGGRSTMSGRCLSSNGRLFTSLVLQAKGRNLITYADVTDYLSLKLKYLPAVQTSLLEAA